MQRYTERKSGGQGREGVAASLARGGAASLLLGLAFLASSWAFAQRPEETPEERPSTKRPPPPRGDTSTEDAAESPLSRVEKGWPGDDFPLTPYIRKLRGFSAVEQALLEKALREGRWTGVLALLEKKAPAKETPSEAAIRAERLLQGGLLADALGHGEEAGRLYRLSSASADPKLALAGRLMRARRAWMQRQPHVAFEALSVIPSPPKGSMKRWEAAAWLLRGLSAASLKKEAESLEAFGILIKRRSSLADFAHWKRLEILASSDPKGFLNEAKGWFGSYPKSRFSPQLRQTIAEVLERQTLCKEAVSTAEAALRSGPPFGVAMALRLLVGRCSLLLKDKEKSSRNFLLVLKGAAGTGYATKAWAALRQIPGEKTSHENRFLVGLHLSRQARLKDAIKIFASLRTELTKPKPPPATKGKGRKDTKDGKETKDSKDTKDDPPKPPAKGEEDKTKKEGPKKANAPPSPRSAASPKTGLRKSGTKGRKGTKRTPVFREDPLLAKILYHEAFAYFQSKEYRPAKELLDRLRKDFAVIPMRKTVDLLWVRCNYRLHRTLAAVKEYESLWEKNKADPRAGRFWLWAAQLYQEHKEYDKALGLLQRYLKRYPKSRERGSLMIQGGLIEYSRSRYTTSLPWWQRGTQGKPAERSRALYWLGKTYSKLKKDVDAKRIWSSLQPLGDSYYHAKAQEKVGRGRLFERPWLSIFALLPDQAEEEAALQSVEAWSRLSGEGTLGAELRRLQQSEGYRRAWLFALAGVVEQTAAEFRGLQRAFPKPVIRFFLARAWLAYGAADRAIQTVNAMLGGLSPERRRGFPRRAILRLQFPLPFPWLYASLAKTYKIRPLLMLAVTRQESAFSPTIVSGAGAVGIAQIMPFEGPKLAKTIGLKEAFHRDLLFRPAINLAMGFAHMRDYLDRHNKQIELTLAAYNAGPAALARWRKEHGDLDKKDLDAFLEYGIGYDETRRYAPSCLRWYSLYRSFRRRDPASKPPSAPSKKRPSDRASRAPSP